MSSQAVVSWSRCAILAVVCALAPGLAAQGNDGDGGGEAPATKCKAGKKLLANGESCDDWAGGPSAPPTGCTFSYDVAILPNGACPDPCKFHMQASATGTTQNPVEILRWESGSNGEGSDKTGPVFVLDQELTVECSATTGSYDCVYIGAGWGPQAGSHAIFQLTCSKCTAS